MKNKGIKYRMYPTEEQEQQLLQEVGNQRFVWNTFLAMQIETYRASGEFIFQTWDILKEVKQVYEFLLLGNVPSLQQTLRDQSHN